METVCDCRTATGDYTTKHLAPLSLKEDTMPTDPNIGMETVCNCRTAIGDTIGSTTKHLASLSLDQFVQMDDKKEDTMLTDPNNPFKDIIVYPPGVVPPPRDFDFVEEIPRRSASEVNPFKDIIVYPPGVVPPPRDFDFVEEIPRRSASEVMFQYAFWQRMKKEREDRVMTTMGHACRTCTNDGAFGCTNGGAFVGFTPPW